MNINQVWPEWQEDCVLGEGSFGKVFRAKRVEYGRTFYSAIKVLTVPKNQQEIKQARSQGMNDNEIYRYFQSIVDSLLNEITLMDNLKGAKNIVGIEDYKIIERQGEIGWDIFIRMELLTPFDSFVNNPSFSVQDVLRLGVDICSALESCEQNRIVHRDIKPDNIFISRFGEYKLGDFGIARKLETTQANLSRKGTLNYMAPEVYRSEPYSSNVDLYSLGLVLYTLLNNNRIAFLPPYPQAITYKDNETALTRRLSGEPLPYPCNAGESLGAVIVKACAFRPQDRFQTATDFKNALLNEWNLLAQSGYNPGIAAEPQRFDTDVRSRLNNTTNDMTANSRRVAGPDPGAYGAPAAPQGTPPAVPYRDPSLQKGIFFLRILAYPLLLAAAVLSFSEKPLLILLIGAALAVFADDRNRFGAGISAAAIGAFQIVTNVSRISFTKDSAFTEILPQVVPAVCGLLMLLAGIVFLTQKKLRLGGTFGIYAAVILIVYLIVSVRTGGAFMTVLIAVAYALWYLSVFAWAYGYEETAPDSTLAKIRRYVSLGLACATLIAAVAVCVTALRG